MSQTRCSSILIPKSTRIAGRYGHRDAPMETPNEPTTPLFKKIVPARGAAQKAAATLKQQTTKRPRNSITQHNSDQSQADDMDDDNESVDDDTDMYRKRKGVGSKGTRGRGRGIGTGVRRHSSQKSTRVVSPSSRPVPSGSFVTPQKRSGPSTSNGTSKRPKHTISCDRTSAEPTGAANLFAISPACRSPSKYANIYVHNDVVWVRLNSRGVLAAPPEPEDKLSYWWPAQVRVSILFALYV